MSNRTSQTLVQAQSLLSNRDYSGALELLGSFDPVGLPKSDEGAYLLLKLEASVGSGVYSIEDADVAIEAFRNSIETASFAHSKFLKGRILIALGEQSAAKQELLESYVHYLRVRDNSCAARSLNWLALVNMQLGNYNVAGENLTDCIRIHHAEGDARKEAVCRMNLGSTFFVAGQLRKASSSYNQIDANLFKSDSGNLAAFFTASSLPNAMRGDFNLGGSLLQSAKAHLVGLDRERANWLEYFGWIALLQGDYKLAEKTLDEGLELSLKIAPQSALISQIKRLLGDLYVATEKFDKAAKYAGEADQVAQKIGQKVEIAACMRIRAQVAIHQTDPKTAGELFRQACEIFTQIDSRYELAVTRYVAATSGCYPQGESVALLQLAREYFESEEVAPFIEKVSAALQKLGKPQIKPRPIEAGGATTQIITRNKRVLRILESATMVAPSGLHVLITGQTGTGKDMLAKYIHERSGFSGKFVSINISAVPTHLAEAELFGYAKGAYTGAMAEKPGLLELAHNGTFFLNEIGEASPEMQAKLLEVLESKTIRRLGEIKLRPAKFRLIAATNVDLRKKMNDGFFRTDLYHRLNQITIELSPLSERPEDFEPLTEHFLLELGWKPNGDAHCISELASVLARRAWPGNIRELSSVLSRLHMESSGSISHMITLADDPTIFVQDDQLEAVLAECDGNKSLAARRLGVPESTLRYRLKKQN